MATARRGKGRARHEDKNVQVCKSAAGRKEKDRERVGGSTAKTLSTLPKFLLGSLAIFYFVAL